MPENVKVRWLVDYEQTKIAPKTLISQVYNDDGTLYEDKVEQLTQNLETSIEDLETALENTVGKKTTGTIYVIDGENVTAGDGAEIFNSYTNNIASGKYSHAENYQTTAKGSYSHAEGYGTLASGVASHAEGYDTKATARYAHAEGASTTASGNNSHAEGNSTTSSGHYSHAEGNFTTSSGGYSHAEGNYTTASETFAHAEGSNTTASATGAHAEGNYTTANGVFAHAEGYYTIASSPYQHVRGEFNIADTEGKYSTIVGNGASDTNRSNAHTLETDGTAWFANDVYVGSTSGTNKDEGSEKLVTENYVQTLYEKLTLTKRLSFYCVEAVTIITNGISKTYPANSNVEINFAQDDVFEIVPTSNSSILSLSAFPGALGTFYPWLEGVVQFSNILFDMNAEDMYTKWNQGNQGAYRVQFAQYSNCIFWSDNPYISDISRRTNYTLYYSAQLPLCYSTIPENTFKAFYMAAGVVNDPNWGNPLYLESFANATWATQVFSYYGARTVGLPGLSVITLPKDCRGLMFDARTIENAGIFDATNTTNFGAKSGSWREAFGDCLSLRRLYISNLKVNLNISWSPINYESISYIISEATNTSAITISVSPYTYNLLSQEDFDLATSKNITIELITANYVEDKRLNEIANKADAEQLSEALAMIEANEGAIESLTSNKINVSDIVNDLTTTSADKVLSANQGVVLKGLIDDIFTGDVIIDGEVKATNVPYTISDTVLLTIPAATIQDAINNGISNLTVDAFVHNPDIIVYANYGGYEYANIINESNYIEFFIADPYKTNGFACSFTLGVDANDNTDETKCKFNYRVLDSENITDLIISQLEVSYIDSKYFDHDLNVIHSISMNRRGAIGDYSISLGSSNVATGNSSCAIGLACEATGEYSMAVGKGSYSTGEGALSGGLISKAGGRYSFATGRYAESNGQGSIAIGNYAKANGNYSKAFGENTIASKTGSSAEGLYTLASSNYQHVQGKYNVEDTANTYAHIVGNGTSTSARSNAYTLDWSGNAWFAGDVYIHSTTGTNQDEDSQKLATETYVNTAIANQTTETWTFTLDDGTTVTKNVVVM